jgi:hypothetical protein
MYQYYKGLIIREGADGLKSDMIKRMYTEVGWLQINHNGKMKSTKSALKIHHGFSLYGIAMT